MSIALTLILPAYNEARRLPPFLDNVRAYLPGQFSDDYEVMVVDDGSTDDLPSIIEEIASDWPQIRVVCHSENQGKGAAVCTGMLMARGELLLFADADGATPIAEESKLRAAIEAGADVAVGSRLVNSPDVTRDRTWFRGLVGRAFALAARSMLRVPVRDTQCGFKMFRRDVGRHLFSLVQEHGYLFDLEILMLAQRLGYHVAEVPVNWSEVEGGHLSVGQHWKMAVAGLWRLRSKRKTVFAAGDTPEG